MHEKEANLQRVRVAAEEARRLVTDLHPVQAAGQDGEPRYWLLCPSPEAGALLSGNSGWGLAIRVQLLLTLSTVLEELPRMVRCPRDLAADLPGHVASQAVQTILATSNPLDWLASSPDRFRLASDQMLHDHFHDLSDVIAAGMEAEARAAFEEVYPKLLESTAPRKGDTP